MLAHVSALKYDHTHRRSLVTTPAKMQNKWTRMITQMNSYKIELNLTYIRRRVKITNQSINAPSQEGLIKKKFVLL